MSSSECLLDTSVTWKDVENEIQKALNTKGKFVEKRKVTSAGDMKGFLSRIALIETDWIGAEENIPLPDKIVVKISTTLALEDLSKITGSQNNESEKKEETEEEREKTERNVRNFHNLEVKMYDVITREANPNMRTVKMYASKPYSDDNLSKGFLVFDYIPNVHSVVMYENIPYEQFVPVIDAIAAFSAMGERMSDEEKKATFGTRHIEYNIGNYFPDKTSEKMRQELMEALGDSFKEKIDSAMEIINAICGTPEMLKKYTTVSEFLGHKPVLMHSDLWSSNMIFTKDSQNKLAFKALIDFQTASFSTPGLDVTAVGVSCLSSEDRNKYQETILNRYYEKFILNLKGSPPPYTLEQLHDSYELCFPAAVILNLPFVWSYAKYVGGSTLETARLKIIGIIEDLLVMQQSNKKKFPEFFKV